MTTEAGVPKCIRSVPITSDLCRILRSFFGTIGRMISSRILHRFFVAATLVAVGLALLFITRQTEALATWTDTASGRNLYRLVFLLKLPATAVGTVFFPVRDHHWSNELTVFSCVVAPWFWFALWMSLQPVRRRVWPPRQTRALSLRDSGDQIEFTRRKFLGFATASAGAVIPGGAGAYGVMVAPQRLHVESICLPIRDLPAEFDGFRIAHMSDLHYGPFVAQPYLEYAIQVVSNLEPDFVFLTGDYSHKSPNAIAPGIQLLEKLRSRLGSVAVLGNHDYWEGADATVAALERIGIPVLTNAKRYLTPGGLVADHSAGPSLCIAGVDDLWDGHPSLATALDGVPADIPRIVLSHNPDVAEGVPSGMRVDLMCAGHTHGGQVRIPFLGTPIVPSAYGQKYAGGLCHGPYCPVLVSRGIGVAMLPIRFGVPPEVGIIELTRA